MKAQQSNGIENTVEASTIPLTQEQFLANQYINGGQPTTIWNGITAEKFLWRCQQAEQVEADVMSYVASLMHAMEPVTVEEFEAARNALINVEQRLIENYTGEVKLNRHGQPFGGTHPALL